MRERKESLPELSPGQSRDPKPVSKEDLSTQLDRIQESFRAPKSQLNRGFSGRLPKGKDSLMSLAERGESRGKGKPGATFSDELVLAICERIEGGESINSICREPDMPNQMNFYRWLEAHPALRETYARAVEIRTEHHADQIIEIADDSTEDVNRSRLRVDARKWIAARLLPKKYGDRIQAELGRPGEFEAIDNARLIAEQIALRLGGKTHLKLIEGKVEAED